MTISPREPRKCQFCENEADAELTLNEKPICRICAHNASHAFGLQDNQVPCPVVGQDNRVLPYGMWPNIDWS